MKRLFMYNLIPSSVIGLIMGIILLFENMSFLEFIGELCFGIYVFILPFYCVSVFWVMHFEYELALLKGALGTALSGILSGVIVYGLCDILEAFRTGIFNFVFMDSEFLPVILLPEAIIIPGTVIIILISLLGKLKNRKNNE